MGGRGAWGLVYWPLGEKGQRAIKEDKGSHRGGTFLVLCNLGALNCLGALRKKIMALIGALWYAFGSTVGGQ
jgi:hypothetical protein